MEDENVFPLLDHGYLKLIDTWGSDQAIVEGARMSTGKGFLGWDPGPCPECNGAKTIQQGAILRGCPACKGKGTHKGDMSLLRYLWKNRHSTPFEMAGMTVEVKAPIMVYREWHRHRTQGYSEASARYAPLPDENYMPTLDRVMRNVTGGDGRLNKQAGTEGDAELTEGDALDWLAALAEVYEYAERVYQMGLRMGVPRELARLSMTVGRYSKMRATCNLRNWMHFLDLRTAPNAQEEIRVYAGAVEQLVQRNFPRVFEVSR